MSNQRIEKLEEGVHSLKGEIGSLKKSFSEILENFEKDTKHILDRIHHLKKTQEQGFEEIIILTRDLMGKVRRVKGGIDQLQNDLLK